MKLKTGHNRARTKRAKVDKAVRFPAHALYGRKWAEAFYRFLRAQ